MSTAEQLVQDIVEKCRRDGWYGPADFRRRRVAWAHPLSFEHGFAFPPATPTQLRETERLLGFSLPGLLRALYLNLANGGFGPGAGLRGTRGGYGNPDTFANGNDETLLKKHGSGAHLVDLATAEWQRTSEGTRELSLPASCWPAQVVPLCDLGCQQEICIDSEGNIFLWYPSEQDDLAFTLAHTQMTLEQWLRRWLNSDES